MNVIFSLLKADCFVDILILVDTSTSADDLRANMASMLVDIVGHLSLGANQARVGLVSFGTTASVIFDYDDYVNSNRLLRVLATIPHEGGGTDFTAAFEIVSMMKSTLYGNRATVPDVVLVVSDGIDNSDDRQFPLDMAREIRRDGTRFIGNNVICNLDVYRIFF